MVFPETRHEVTNLTVRHDDAIIRTLGRYQRRRVIFIQHEGTTSRRLIDVRPLGPEVQLWLIQTQT